MYDKVLQQAGLNQKQARVYLACLELGRSKVPEIAKKAGLKRTSTYDILDQLLSLGLVSYSTRGKTRYYQADDPSLIEQRIEQNKKNLHEIMPHLQELFTTHYFRPKVNYYEGREGIKRIYEDTLKCRSKKIYQIVRVKDFIDFPSREFSEKYIKQRVARKITALALHPKSGDIYDETYGQESEKLLRHVKYLPADTFHASMIMIYDHKVAMISTRKENFGFIIESKEFSQTLLAYFHYMWRLASSTHEGVSL